MPPQVSLGMALLAEGLQRGLAWARRSIVEPHGEHVDVSEHPDCVLCVALVALQGATQASQSDVGPRWNSAQAGHNQSGSQQPSSEQRPAVTISWVPVRRQSAGSSNGP